MSQSVVLGMCSSCKEWVDFWAYQPRQLELFNDNRKWFSECCSAEPLKETLEEIPLDDGAEE